MECEFCDGSGKVDNELCDDCNGLGYVCDVCGEPCKRNDDYDHNPDEQDYCDSCELCYEDELDFDDYYGDDPYP